MTHEILNFQFGSLSNHIGSHWWNLQESTFVYNQDDGRVVEIDHDVMFREGLTLEKEVTYTPRLICAELRDYFGSLKLEGALYDFDTVDDTICWAHDVTLHKSNRDVKNEYLQDLDKAESDLYDSGDKGECSSREEVDESEKKPPDVSGSSKSDEEIYRNKFYYLDDNIKTWTDYLRTHLHPKTLTSIKSYTHSDSSFNIHGYSQNVLSEPDFNDDMENKIHFFTEDCDQLQGFHVIADIFNGFGGLTTHYRQYLEEEFSKKGCIVFCPLPTDHGKVTNPSLDYLINTVMSFTKLCNSGCTVVPMSVIHNPWKSVHPKYLEFSHLDYKPTLDYHTSAIYSAALDTMTLSHRSQRSFLPMSSLTDTLSTGGRQISDLSLCLPLPLQLGKSASELLTSDSFNSLTPLYDLSSSTPIRRNVQSVIMRGVRPTGKLQEHINTLYPRTQSCVAELNYEFNTIAPYPHIFTRDVNQFGLISQQNRHNNQGVDKVAVAAALSTTDSSLNMLEHLHQRAKKLNRSHLHKHLEAGLEMVDWAELIEQLGNLCNKYKEDDMMSTDDDD